MKHLSALILVFAVFFMVFFISLVFLRMPFSAYPMMSVQDALDILTPVVLLPLYFLLYRLESRVSIGVYGLVIFSVFAAFWAAGQGMHLSANSIHNLMTQKGMETGGIHDLTYFYDEILSHYLWHVGVVGLSGLLIYRQWKNPFSQGRMSLSPIVLGGVLYGFSYFLIIIEGNTAPLGVTFSVLATAFILIWARKRIGQQPIVAFFLISYALAMLLFLIWGLINGGLVPIMDVIKI